MSGPGGAAPVSFPWREEDEEFRAGGGVRGGLKTKPRFSFTEVKMLLEAVKKNRYIILRKFNHGVSSEVKKQTWAEITNQINGLGENHREVRQIMKKWADLKCDGKRRILALRGPNGSHVRKKNLGPVEKMVHKILMMSPKGDGDSEPEFGDDDDACSTLHSKGSNPSNCSYLSLTDSSYSLPGGFSFDISPLSSPEKDLGDPFHSSSDFDLDAADDRERTMDYDDDDDNDDSMFSSYSSSLPPPASAPVDSPSDSTLPKFKVVHTYSRNGNNNNNSPAAAAAASSSSRPPPGSSTSSAPPSASDAADTAVSSGLPPPSQSPTSSPVTTASKAADSHPVPSTSSAPPPPAAPPASAAAESSSSSAAPPATSQPPPSSSSSSTSSSSSSSPLAPPEPLPAGASAGGARDHVAQMAAQSLQQQRAGRMLLTSVSQSLEMLAQSVQLLVESQQEFVQESLMLQRETVDILRDFSNTALTMLRDKSNSGQLAAHHHHQHTAPRF